ncbi:hypothetical protein KQX54_002510 [Cotesia glomerata]|uniref:Uncharacterized protein n=1 Tax=Cotesia glomerata TaxID=32391 RepID=A0AAV7IIZ3_COTGL|nr:hypothetical protein KQX54_002510 [Cotesia glomerata]
MLFDIPENRLYSLGENPTLLHAAIVDHDVEMVEILINHGADIHYRTKSFKRTPLMLAIEENTPQIVIYFELDFMLVDHEILETVKLNTTLLSEEQLEDQNFMNKLKKLFMRLLEGALIIGILRGDLCVKKIDENRKRTIFSKPVNDFGILSESKLYVKRIEYDLNKCITAMKEHRIGTSTLLKSSNKIPSKATKAT